MQFEIKSRVYVVWASKARTNRISWPRIVWLWFNIICHLPHRYVNVSGGLSSDSFSSLMSWLMITCNGFPSFELCFNLYTLCSGDSHFSSVQSQTLPLFTRGIIKHMATVCLWCQIAHKEWVHCLLGEMVANWCSWLSAIRGHRALTGRKCALHNSNNIAALCRGITLHHACIGIWQEHYLMYF